MLLEMFLKSYTFSSSVERTYIPPLTLFFSIVENRLVLLYGTAMLSSWAHDPLSYNSAGALN